MTPIPSLVRRCAFLLALLLVAVACGGDGADDTAETDPPADTAAATTAETDADAPTEAEDPTEAGTDADADEAEETEPSAGAEPAGDVPDEYVLGWINPLSGTSAIFGELSRNATEMAVAEINESGGINGADLRIIYEDNEFQLDPSITAFERLMQEDPPAVLTAGSSVVLALSPLATSNEVILANIGAQSPVLSTDAHPDVYNFIPTSALEAQRLAERIHDDLGITRMGVLLVDNDYGIDTSQSFIEAYEELGGEIVREERHELGGTDMRTQLIQIRGADPEGLLIVSNVGEVGHAAAQTRELGLDIPLFGLTFSLSPDNFAIAGDAMDGMRGIAVTFQGTGDVGEDFGARYEEMHGTAPTVYAAVAYDSVRILAEAMTEVGDDPAAIGEYLLTVSDFPGVMGSTTIGENREVQFDLTEWEIEGGEVGTWEQ